MDSSKFRMASKLERVTEGTCRYQILTTASFERRKYENQKTLSPKNIKVLFGIMDRMEKFKINWFLVYR